MSLITVIGRGHSGTRAISHTLYSSGVYMGRLLNPSGDKVPPEEMYDACRVMAKYVKWKGRLCWEFSPLHTMQIDKQFEALINSYLEDVLSNESENQGWKIPETTLVYPWITRMFPDIKYIHWIRDPRDCILSPHGTDDLQRFGVEYSLTDDVRKRRAISWLYQYQIMQSTPKPKNYILIRFEDFVLRQEETLSRLEDFLGIPLARIIVRPEAVDRWRKDPGPYSFEFLADAMCENGYGEELQ
jgi:hypothetical protein